MTPAAISVNAPHGKWFYGTIAIAASLFACAGVWATFASDTPMVWRLVDAGITAILLIGAMQAFERLLAPARAHARSAAISDAARGRLLVLRNVLGGLGTTGYVIAGALRLVTGSRGADLMELSAVCIFAGGVVADICGERR